MLPFSTQVRELRQTSTNSATSARGAILLIHSKPMRTFDDLFAEYMRNPVLLEGARKTGAAALLLESTRLRGRAIPPSADVRLLHRARARRPSSRASTPNGSPASRLLGPVRMRLRLTNRIGGPYQSRNVVAEIRGRESPDEVVLLGAHLDSWDLGTGAEDNGVNAALVLDVARGFQQLGVRPRRTVRFVLFTGEEQGMWGSAGYAATHRAELGNHRAVVIFDTGSGHVSGFYLNGREELRKPLNTALDAVGGVNATEHSADALDGTDNFDFMLAGVPNLVAIQDPAPYLPDYHAESDVYERSNLEEQRTSVAVASAVVYGLAETPGTPAPRQTRDEVEKLLIQTKMDEQMRIFGQWTAWKAGRRGLF